MENFLAALNCVFPIFVYLAVGYLAKRGRFVPEETFPQLNRLCFYILIPCSLFASIYSSDAGGLVDFRFLLVSEGMILIIFLLGLLYCRLFVPDPGKKAVLCQTFFRPNVGIIGMAMIQAIYPTGGSAAMAVYIALSVPTFNALAVYVFERCRGGRISPGKLVRNILKNPFVLGCLAGLLAKFSGIRIPDLLMNPVTAVGKAGSVLAIVTLGATFRLNGLREDLGDVIRGTLIRLVIVPVLGLSAVIALGFRNELLAVFILALGGPMASGSYSMAQVYGSDYKLAGELVVVTSLLCCLTIFIWIYAAKLLSLM